MVPTSDHTTCSIAYTGNTGGSKANYGSESVPGKPDTIGLCGGGQNARGLVRIVVTYPGTNNYSSFTYDGLDHNVQIVETQNGSVTSTKQFVWCGKTRCEARNATGSITSQYLAYGQTIGGSDYYYTKDRLHSVRELTDSSGNVQAAYAYDPYGRMTKLQGSIDSDFQYAGYYNHAPSRLNLTRYRPFNSNLGRWINRDPVAEIGGINLYAYVMNDPITWSDRLGLFRDNDGGSIDSPGLPPVNPWNDLQNLWNNYQNYLKHCHDPPPPMIPPNLNYPWVYPPYIPNAPIYQYNPYHWDNLGGPYGPPQTA